MIGLIDAARRSPRPSRPQALGRLPPTARQGQRLCAWGRNAPAARAVGVVRGTQPSQRKNRQPGVSIPGEIRFARRPQKDEIFLLHSEKHCGIKILPTKRGAGLSRLTRLDRCLSPPFFPASAGLLSHSSGAGVFEAGIDAAIRAGARLAMATPPRGAPLHSHFGGRPPACPAPSHPPSTWFNLSTRGARSRDTTSQTRSKSTCR